MESCLRLKPSDPTGLSAAVIGRRGWGLALDGATPRPKLAVKLPANQRYLPMALQAPPGVKIC